MTKTPATLAQQIEREMHRAWKDCAFYQSEHCTLYENDFEHICPRKDKDRKKKLVRFAEQSGFRLRFYREGLCAIFGKRGSPGRQMGDCFMKRFSGARRTAWMPWGSDLTARSRFRRFGTNPDRAKKDRHPIKIKSGYPRLRISTCIRLSF